MALAGCASAASWTFVVWGLLHGGLLIAHRGVQAVCARRPALDGCCNLMRTAARWRPRF